MSHTYVRQIITDNGAVSVDPVMGDLYDDLNGATLTGNFYANNLTGTNTGDQLGDKSITIVAGYFELLNDATSPGNSYYYGTDSGGTKGYFALPAGTGAAIGGAVSGGTANRVLFLDGSGNLDDDIGFTYQAGGTGMFVSDGTHDAYLGTSAYAGRFVVGSYAASFGDDTSLGYALAGYFTGPSSRAVEICANGKAARFTDGTRTVDLCDGTNHITYTPTTSADWASVPTDVWDALDTLAAGGGGTGLETVDNISTNTTLTALHQTINAVGGLGGITLQLPPSTVGTVGKVYWIFKGDATVGTITITPDGIEGINSLPGGTSVVITNQWDLVRLESNVSGEWFLTYIPTGLDVTARYTPTTSSDWAGTAPTTVTDALDRCATLLKALNGGTGP